MKLFYTDEFELPLPATHQFPMSKYRLLRERVAASDQLPGCPLLVPEAATDEQLRRVHTHAWVRSVRDGTLSTEELRRIGFPWSRELVERSRRSVGGTIAAARAASEEGCGVNLAGGTHHSFPHAGAGYCVFNDVAVAVRDLQTQSLVSNVVVIDCDAHQGDGTAAIFANDPSVFTFSIHAARAFPARKQTSDLDIALEDGTRDDEYLQRLRRGLGQVERTFRPDLAFYVSGADPYEQDRLGRLKLTKTGLARRDEEVLSWCERLELPVAVVMAGGYCPAVDEIVDIHFSTICSAGRLCR